MTIERYDASGRMSRAVAHADLLFLGGLTADDLAQDTAGQTRQILAKIDHYLAAGGSERSRLLSAQIWLRNISDFDQMNAEWDDWVDRENPPARATVEARLAGERYLVEIMVVAARR
jgi:enamine deaminase RidA (YjgF/YER057c/UK114 family)